MACHLKYFDVRGYFKSLGYVNEMGINLSENSIFGVSIKPEDQKNLEEAIARSDEDTKKGELAGIVQLIQTVEGLQDKYGVTHEHKHPTDVVVKAMCERQDLVSHYHLEKLAQQLFPGRGHHHHHHQPTTYTLVRPKKDTKSGG